MHHILLVSDENVNEWTPMFFVKGPYFIVVF
jgi:hypothetical protein